ncbi:MAG: hypothetical protein ACRDBL_12160 [Rhabdaerophilum sp.]
MIVLAISPMLCAFFWIMWEDEIKPRLIPEPDIRALAVAHVARYGERAAEMAFIEEDRAWRYSDSFAQGKWKRVRQEIERLSLET